MAVHQIAVHVETKKRLALLNITDLVANLTKGKIDGKDGLLCAYVPHTTCALLINEDEPGLREDILRLSAEMLAPLRKQAPFGHDRVDNNAQAHLTSLLFGPSVTVPIANGRLKLGTWQSLFFLELDGPRKRDLHLQVITD